MTAATIRRPEERTKLWTDVPFTKAPTSSTGELVLSGYASTWGLDRDEEMVARNAFDKSLNSYLAKNPMLLWQHSMDWPIGAVTGAHTDDNGLFVTASVPDPGPSAADWQKGAYTAIRTGVVRTFSIGGYMSRDVKTGPDGGPLFVISEVDLFEISAVSIPANPDSIFEAAVKAISGERPRLGEKAESQMEQLLGFKTLADPQLVGMDEDERRERYEMLKTLFVRANGVEPPAYDAFRTVNKAIAAGVSVQKTVPAVKAVADALYHPQAPEEDEKAGRTISAANKTKLEGALASHEELAGHVIDAAESLKSMAAAHTIATNAIKDVLGIMDAEPDPDDDAREDERSPEKAARFASPRAKQLMSDISRQLQNAGQERYGQASLGQDAPMVWVADADLDAGFVVFDVYGGGADRLVQVPVLRGQDGTVALGDGETEVESVTSFKPKSVEEAETKDTGPGDGSDPPTPETPDPAPADVDQKAVANTVVTGEKVEMELRPTVEIGEGGADELAEAEPDDVEAAIE